MIDNQGLGTAPKQKLWTRSFLVITSVNFLAAMNFYLLMIVISRYAIDRFSASPGVAGLAAGIFVIGGLVGRLLGGRAMTRVSQTKTLYAGVLLSLVMTLLYFAARSTALLLLIRFLHGVSFGVTTTATGTIVARLVPRERYGEGIGYYSLSQTMATAIGPFIGILLSQRGSFDSIIVACSIASAIGLVILPLLSVNEVELTGEQADEAKGFRLSNFIEPKVVPIALVSMTTYICYSTVVSFLSVYSQAIHLVTAASFFFIVYAAAVFITRPLVGRRFDAKGENSVMYPAIPVFAIGMAVFSQAHSAYVLLVAGALIGCGLGAIQSSGQAISVKITRLHRMGLAISTFFMFSDIGMGTGPLLAGLVVPFIGYRGMYTVVAIVAAGCLFLYYALYGRRPLVAA